MRSAILISAAALALRAVAQDTTVNTASATFLHFGQAMEALPVFDPDIDLSVEVMDANTCITTYNIIATYDLLGKQTVSDYCNCSLEGDLSAS